MRRREFITLLGGAAVAWPLSSGAQQSSLPLIGFIRDGSAEASKHYVAAFRRGLSEAGYFEGRNLTVEYHWIEGEYDRLPALMDDLIRRQVAVIVTPGGVPTQAAKAATDHPDRFRRWRRPDPTWSCCQPSSAGGQCDRHQFLFPGGGREVIAAAA